MADNNVNITGIDPGALSGLPEWATETTIKRIESVLNKSFGVQGKMLAQMMKSAGSNALTPDEIRKLNDEIKKLITNTKTLREEDKKVAEQAEDREKDRQEFMKIAIAKLSTATSILLNTMKQNMETFDKLYASGINVVSGFDGVTDGFQALQHFSLQTGVRYTELSATLQKFSSAINVFGLGRFAKALSASSAELRQYGFSTKEAGELLGQYLEIQRGYAGSAQLSQEAATRGVVEFGKRITSVSIATGMARDLLMQQVDALSKSSEALILNATVGGDATQATLEYIASFKDQQIGQQVLRMITDSIKPLNTTFMNFQKLGMGGFGQQMMTFANSLKNLSAFDAQKRTADFVKSNQAALDAMTKQANLYRQAGMQAEADAILSMIGGLRQQAAAFNKMSEEDQKKMKMTSDASVEFKNAMESIKSSLQVLFAPFAQALTIAAKGLSAVATAITYVETVIPGLTRVLGTAVVAVGLFVSALVAAKSAMAIGKFAGIVGGGGGGGGGKGSGGGIGDILGGGKDTDKKGGGIIAAVKGLAALGGPAAPKILLGATVLSGVIAILGVGFAAAAYVIGKAMPTFAEGFVKFSEVDGNNLGLVGKGLLSLSIGLGAFTAVMATAATGNLFTSMVNGLTSLFGGDTIMSRISQFASIGPGLEMAGNGLVRIAEGINNIDLAKAEQLSNILPKISASGLSTTAMGAIQTSTIDSPSTVSSSGVSGSQAPKPEIMSAGGAGREEVAGQSSIHSILSTQNGLIERLVNSNNDLISINRDMLKYIKAQA